MAFGCGINKKAMVRVNETEQTTFEGKEDVALIFNAWADSIDKLVKQFGTMDVTIPEHFHAWLLKAAVKANSAAA